jgi:hypothetical protein
MNHKHENGGAPQKCESCRKTKPLGFTCCCGQLVCDDCHDNHSCTLLTCTVDDVMSWRPCSRYSKADIERLFAGRDRLSALEILDVDIPIRDKFWSVLRVDLIAETTLRELACDYAEYCLPMRPRIAIETKRRWLKGEATDAELKDAADAAADTAAFAAAFAAADAAADAAAFAADTAAFAAKDAADAAAFAAADAALLEITRKKLEAINE